MSDKGRILEPVPKGVARGPRSGWGGWRSARTRKIESPKRNKAAQEMHARLAAKKPGGT